MASTEGRVDPFVGQLRNWRDEKVVENWMDLEGNLAEVNLAPEHNLSSFLMADLEGRLAAARNVFFIRTPVGPVQPALVRQYLQRIGAASAVRPASDKILIVSPNLHRWSDLKRDFPQLQLSTASSFVEDLLGRSEVQRASGFSLSIVASLPHVLIVDNFSVVFQTLSRSSYASKLFFSILDNSLSQSILFDNWPRLQSFQSLLDHFRQQSSSSSSSSRSSSSLSVSAPPPALPVRPVCVITNEFRSEKKVSFRKDNISGITSAAVQKYVKEKVSISGDSVVLVPKGLHIEPPTNASILHYDSPEEVSSLELTRVQSTKVIFLFLSDTEFTLPAFYLLDLLAESIPSLEKIVYLFSPPAPPATRSSSFTTTGTTTSSTSSTSSAAPTAVVMIDDAIDVDDTPEVAAVITEGLLIEEVLEYNGYKQKLEFDKFSALTHHIFIEKNRPSITLEEINEFISHHKGSELLWATQTLRMMGTNSILRENFCALEGYFEWMTHPFKQTLDKLRGNGLGVKRMREIESLYRADKQADVSVDERVTFVILFCLRHLGQACRANFLVEENDKFFLDWEEFIKYLINNPTKESLSKIVDKPGDHTQILEKAVEDRKRFKMALDVGPKSRSLSPRSLFTHIISRLGYELRMDVLLVERTRIEKEMRA